MLSVGFSNDAVTTQPRSGFGGTGHGGDPVPDDWMSPPQNGDASVIMNCPPGLEHLAVLDEIYIQQIINWKEICLGCEFKQSYEITHPQTGKKIYKAKEDSECCQRFWCANARSLEMALKDHADREVLKLSRPFHCAGLMCPPCMDEFNISTPDGQLLGSVRQKFAWLIPKLDVFDANGAVVFNIEGPCCHCTCGGDVRFKIYSPGESTEVGAIVKRWTGAAKECCTDVDNFRIEFPRKLDVRIKACLIGACFSIDLLFYENQNQ